MKTGGENKRHKGSLFFSLLDKGGEKGKERENDRADSMRNRHVDAQPFQDTAGRRETLLPFVNSVRKTRAYEAFR